MIMILLMMIKLWMSVILLVPLACQKFCKRLFDPFVFFFSWEWYFNDEDYDDDGHESINDDDDDVDENYDVGALRSPRVEQNVHWSICFFPAQLLQLANGQPPLEKQILIYFCAEQKVSTLHWFDILWFTYFKKHPWVLFATLPISTSPSSDRSMLSYKPCQEIFDAFV